MTQSSGSSFCTLRDNAAPPARAGSGDPGGARSAGAEARQARHGAGPRLRRGHRSPGGQWQRVALARAMRGRSAPASCCSTSPAQLDVRGEAEIFDRVLAATRRLPFLISHRFSRSATPIGSACSSTTAAISRLTTSWSRKADYQAMFDLQAQRFHAAEDEEGQRYDILAETPRESATGALVLAAMRARLPHEPGRSLPPSWVAALSASDSLALWLALLGKACSNTARACSMRPRSASAWPPPLPGS